MRFCHNYHYPAILYIYEWIHLATPRPFFLVSNFLKLYVELLLVWQWLPLPAWVMPWHWHILTGLEVKPEAENELLWQLLHGNVMNPSLSPFTKGWYWLSVIGIILLTIVGYVGWLTKCIWQINTRGDNDGGANHLFLTVSLKKPTKRYTNSCA